MAKEQGTDLRKVEQVFFNTAHSTPLLKCFATTGEVANMICYRC
jgi:hypothetical protein